MKKPKGNKERVTITLDVEMDEVALAVFQEHLEQDLLFVASVITGFEEALKAAAERIGVGSLHMQVNNGRLDVIDWNIKL
jgi:hypothetical protein